MEQLHAISLMGATLRNLGERCCHGVKALNRSLTEVRRAFVKVCSAYGGSEGSGNQGEPTARFANSNEAMLHELQVLGAEMLL